MIVKNLASAIIGLWFVFTPWLFGFAEQQEAFIVCVVLGSIQCISSLLAGGRTGKGVWQNWIALFVGACFIIYPNIYYLEITEFSLTALLGFITIFLNYSNLFPDQL